MQLLRWKVSRSLNPIKFCPKAQVNKLTFVSYLMSFQSDGENEELTEW